jgi:quercetin dioxygenase-like cupin family protein
METIPTPKTGKGESDKFIGDVFVDGITVPDAGVVVAWVHFTPGARNAWHTHATGQTLHCTDGYGLVVTDDEVIALRPGVTAWTPPGQRHWHGAIPDHFMTHLAISATGPEPGAVWGEHITDEEYAEAVSRLG